MSVGKNIIHNLYESVEESKFSGVEFEKNLDHEMRFKEYGTHNTDYDIPEGTLYWVTQEPFTKEQLIKFGKALNKSKFDTAYVTVRDLSTYDYERDLANNVLAKVDKDGNIDFDGYWNEAKVFFDDEELTESENTNKITPEQFLESTINVYDLATYIQSQKIGDGSKIYTTHTGDKRALLQDVNGNYILADYEAVRELANSDSDLVKIEVSEKPEEGTFAIMPAGSINLAISDIKQAPVEQMKAKDFFTKYNYNARCENNFEGLIRNLNGNYTTLSGDYVNIPIKETEELEVEKTLEEATKSNEIDMTDLYNKIVELANKYNLDNGAEFFLGEIENLYDNLSEQGSEFIESEEEE